MYSPIKDVSLFTGVATLAFAALVVIDKITNKFGRSVPGVFAIKQVLIKFLS